MYCEQKSIIDRTFPEQGKHKIIGFVHLVVTTFY